MWYCNSGWSYKSNKRNSTAPIIKAGRFRNLVTIQTPQIIQPDGGGGGVYGWSEVVKVWAYIKTYDAGTTHNYAWFEEAQLRDHRKWLVTIRYPYQQLTTAMRLLFKDQVLEIDGIVNVNEYNWEVQLYCREDGVF